jgi:hypothetical protein
LVPDFHDPEEFTTAGSSKSFGIIEIGGRGRRRFGVAEVEGAGRTDGADGTQAWIGGIYG